MARRFAIPVTLVAGVAVALWLWPERSANNAAPSSLERSALPEETGHTAAAPAENVEREAADSTAVASEPATEALSQTLAGRAYDGFGSRLVEYLAGRGLSRTDAETIVAELMRKTVTCVLDALRDEALEQRVEFDRVLDALEAELHDADGPPVSALVDAAAVDRRAMPCSVTALAQAGIPPQAAYELFPRASR